MPRWTVVLRAVRSRMASSFWPAAAVVVSIAATSPSQPCSFASRSQSPRLARISSSWPQAESSHRISGSANLREVREGS
jgi:hypothetical protein